GQVSMCSDEAQSIRDSYEDTKSKAPGFSAAWTIALVMTSAENPGSLSTAARENSCTKT
ncbi:hypothetical protein STEG23_021919, partial [Scotinomys teguina]